MIFQSWLEAYWIQTAARKSQKRLTRRLNYENRPGGTMSEKPLLEMIGIDKTFGRQTVLKNCSLEVQRGETWC